LTYPTDYTWAITSVDGTGTSAGTNVGEVTITVTGVGLYSGTLTGTYTILSSNTTITDVVVDNTTADQTGNNFYADAVCNQNTVVVTVTADQYATVTIDGVPGNVATVNLTEIGENVVTIVVTAQDGSSTSYTLTINRPLPFFDIVVKRWNNTLTVINNPANNGGYTFTSFKWFRDGVEIGTDQSWSAGPNGESIPAGDYRVEVTADGFNGVIKSCIEFIAASRSMSVIAYPNPVGSGQLLNIDIDVDDNMLEGATIDVYNIAGSRVAQLSVQGRLTTVPINYASGVYIFVLKGKDDFRKELKVLVQ